MKTQDNAIYAVLLGIRNSVNTDISVSTLKRTRNCFLFVKFITFGASVSDFCSQIKSNPNKILKMWDFFRI